MFNSKQNNAYELNSYQYWKRAKISKTWNVSMAHEVKLKAVSKFGFQLVTNVDAHTPKIQT